MRINPYMAFDGNCREAFNFYQKALGGEIVMMFTHGESPMAESTTPELRDKIMHARLVVGDTELMGSDAMPNGYKNGNHISVSINVDTPDEAEKTFAALSDKATITMPLQETFWAKRFGMLTDQFGIAWMLNCENKPE